MNQPAEQIAACLSERLKEFFAALDAAENDAIARAQKITEPYIGKEEAAEFLNISVSTLENWMDERNGPPRYKRGARVNFLRSELRVWYRRWRAGDQRGLPEPQAD